MKEQQVRNAILGKMKRPKINHKARDLKKPEVAKHTLKRK